MEDNNEAWTKRGSGKVWDPKRESANLLIWQSNWRICRSRFGQTFDVFKKKIS
jgi:hypothetical protein